MVWRPRNPLLQSPGRKPLKQNTKHRKNPAPMMLSQQIPGLSDLHIPVSLLAFHAPFSPLWLMPRKVLPSTSHRPCPRFSTPIFPLAPHWEVYLTPPLLHSCGLSPPIPDAISNTFLLSIWTIVTPLSSGFGLLFPLVLRWTNQHWNAHQKLLLTLHLPACYPELSDFVCESCVLCLLPTVVPSEAGATFGR